MGIPWKGNPLIVIEGRSVPVRGGRGRHSAPERKDVGHGKDDEEVAWNDVPNYQQTGNPSGAWGYGPSTR